MSCEGCRHRCREGCPISEAWLERLLDQVGALDADARAALLLDRVFGAPLDSIARVLSTSDAEADALQRVAEAELRAACVRSGCGCVDDAGRREAGDGDEAG